ncbi:MAG: PAS domain-containing protein, partial [Oligoflexia bacterium]|nr:PAS domain-containing protein [Oligoflexia bacterium]
IILIISILVILLLASYVLQFNSEKNRLIVEVSEERLSLALKAADLGLWDYDISEKIFIFNVRWSEIMDISHQEITLALDEFLSNVFDEDRKKVSEVINAQIYGRSNILEVEYRLLLKGEKYGWVALRGKVVEWDSKGYPLRATGTILDINGKRKIEEEKKRLEANLFKNAKLASLSTLVAGASHEISNPLAIMKGSLVLLKNYLIKEKLNEGVTKFIDRQEIACERISSVIEGLKLYADPLNAQVRDYPEKLNIHSLIFNLLDILRVGYKRDFVEIETNFLATKEHITASRGSMHQVLINIINNAKLAIKDARVSKGLIKIETRNQDNFIIVSVSDNGIGMDQKTRASIFDPFFTTRAPGEGTGLGLSITYSVIKGLNGSIEVESEKNKGTLVFIKLPIESVVVAKEQKAI